VLACEQHGSGARVDGDGYDIVERVAKQPEREFDLRRGGVDQNAGIEDTPSPLVGFVPIEFVIGRERPVEGSQTLERRVASFGSADAKVEA
jgi:hypothetical protein